MKEIKYVSPCDKSILEKKGESYVDRKGNVFPIINKIPNLIFPKELPQSDQKSLDWYKINAENYDEYLPLTFETFNVNEDKERTKMIDFLKIDKDHKILEIGCGTGRDSIIIAERLGEGGELYLQDISKEILDIGIEKFSKLNFKPKIEFSLSNGYYLPFEDKVFDSVFHFGGLNTFGDIKRALSEMVRVTKVGGRIVVGDESIPIWLRDTEFGKVLMNSNPHFKFELPLKDLPVEARNIRIDWIIGGVFYVISFDVGEDVPYANIDFKIPGIRGGTHRTRYYGHIEGITPETKELVIKARKKTGKNMHDWLDSTIKKEAIKVLKGDKDV